MLRICHSIGLLYLDRLDALHLRQAPLDDRSAELAIGIFDVQDDRLFGSLYGQGRKHDREDDGGGNVTDHRVFPFNQKIDQRNSGASFGKPSATMTRTVALQSPSLAVRA